MSNPLVSIIVPTKNSGELLEDFLNSLKNQTYKNIEVVVNDDVNTVDETNKIVEKYKQDGLNVQYFQKNLSMAQGRKTGAEQAQGEIMLHVDSDMTLDPKLVAEVVTKINDKFDALIIPEESFGTSFWARCKWLEKKCYEGVEQIESLRCLKTSAYKLIGGHNPTLVFSEDKDLDIRIKKAGYKVGRTENYIRHNEGHLSLRKTLKKKLFYTNTADQFAELHPDQFKWQRNIFFRYFIFIKNWRYFITHPFLYAGMFFIKTSEFLFGGIGLLISRGRN